MDQRTIRQASLKEVDDTTPYRRAVVEVYGKKTEVLLFTPYGISTNPPVDSLGVVFQTTGNEGVKYSMMDNAVARFKNLEPGEVQLGNYGLGSVKFAKDGNIIINSDSATITMEPGGAITIDTDGSDVTVIGDVIADGISLIKHVHPILSGSSAPGPTGEPE